MSSTPDRGMFSRDPDLPNLIVTSHPLLRHKVTLLRKRDTPKKIFKELVDEIAMLLAYEVTSDLGTETVRVETPLESTTGECPCRSKVQVGKQEIISQAFSS